LKSKKDIDKYKVAIFAYWHDKGWEKFVGATVKIWDLARNTAALGHHVVLFLPRYHFAIDGLRFRLVQIPLIELPFLRALSFNFFLTSFLVLYYFKSKPDVVYVRRGISLIPSIFAKIKKSLLFYEINDDPYPERMIPTSSLISRVNAWLSLKTDELSLSICDAAFVITKKSKRRLSKRNRRSIKKAACLAKRRQYRSLSTS